MGTQVGAGGSLGLLRGGSGFCKRIDTLGYGLQGLQCIMPFLEDGGSIFGCNGSNSVLAGLLATFVFYAENGK